MQRTVRTPLLAALATFTGLVLTGLVAFLVPLGRQRDSATLQGFRGLNQPWLNGALNAVAHLANPVPYLCLGLALVGVAVARHRGRVAGAILALLLLTGATTHLLKAVLASPRYDEWLGSGQIAAASWPSGHATAAMTLALCAILAAPARLRPTVAALGAGFAISVSYSILALGWHFPSDVLGGFLVAMTWTLLAVAVLVRVAERHPNDARRESALRPGDALAPLALGLGALAILAAAGLTRPADVSRYAADHSTFMVGAAVIAALAVTLSLGLARGVRSA